MDTRKRLQQRFRDLTSEHGLLIMFLAVAGYMFVRAEAWGHNSRIFPQMMAGAVIVGTVLLLVQDYLPGPIRTIVTGEASAFGRTEVEFEDELEEVRETPAEPEAPAYDRPVNPVLFTAVLITAYAVVGYLLSFLVASPLFAATYLVWFRKPWPLVLLLTLVAALIAFAFATVIIVPVDRGILVGDLLMLGGL